MSRWRRHVRAHLPALPIAPEREIEIVEELALQLEAAYDGARARGASEAAAVARACAEVPDWQALAATLARIERPVPRASVPDYSRGDLMAGFIQDVRYGLRVFVRAPVFAAIAVTTLALGIGATTIIYSLVDGILLKPLPIAEPDGVVLARELTPSGQNMSVSWPNFVDWQTRATSFQGLAAWRGLPANLTGIDRPRRVMIRQVTWNLFSVLGVHPVLGRDLTESDDRPGVERVGLVSYGFWQRELGGDTAAIGRRIMLDETAVTVVGVLPPDFSIARQEDAFVPFGSFLTPGSFLLGRGNHNGLAAIGRLAPGATIESARAEIAAIAGQLAAEYPATNSGQSSTVLPLFDVLVDNARATLTVLLGAVLAMLLIGCANLANLLLARASSREQELAVRRALGADRWRIARQLLTESVLIALAGGAAGALLAWFGFGAVVAMLPTAQARVHLVSLDLRVFAVAGAITVMTGLLFGLAPALQAATAKSMSLLRTTRVAGSGTSRSSTRNALLLAEVALAMILLAGAGLMIRTMVNLLAVEPGFTVDGVLSAQISLPPTRYDAAGRRAFFDAVLERAKAKPGVIGAALTLSLPVQGSNWNSVFIVSDQPVPNRADLPSAAFTPVTPDYHQTMGIRLLRGRLLQPSDQQGAATVTVVNETLARRFWPNGDAIGQRIKQGWPEDKTPWREIVGIVADVKTSGVDQPSALQAYVPLSQEPFSSVALVMRTTAGLRAQSMIEAAVHEVDPALPVYDIRSLNEVIGLAVGQQRLATAFLAGFALLALLIAAIGVFGVTAYAVSQRTHEIGVRMALGATRRTVLALVLRQELMVCVAGIVIGVAGALLLSSVLQSLVFGVPTRDPLTLAVVTLLLLLVTAVAGYLPARRATVIDPVTAMRAE